MSVNDDGGLEVLIPDPDEDGTYYKLNMSSREDGTMAVWAVGADGETVEYASADWDDESDRVGYFGIRWSSARDERSVNFTPADGTEGDGGEGDGGGGAPWSGGGGGEGGEPQVWFWPAGQAVT